MNDANINRIFSRCWSINFVRINYYIIANSEAMELLIDVMRGLEVDTLELTNILWLDDGIM